MRSRCCRSPSSPLPNATNIFEANPTIAAIRRAVVLPLPFNARTPRTDRAPFPHLASSWLPSSRQHRVRLLTAQKYRSGSPHVRRPVSLIRCQMRRSYALRYRVEPSPTTHPSSVWRFIYACVCAPCGRHLGRINRQDQCPILRKIKRRPLTPVEQFDSGNGRLRRICYESMALFFLSFQRARESKKIIIFLTLKPPQLPPPKAAPLQTSSHNALFLKDIFCHRPDMRQLCTLTIAATKRQRKSPAKSPGSLKNA